MAKGENQKLKLLYLVKIFMECTDEEHGLTMQEIIGKLKSYDVNADRKTLYLDFDELRNFGLDIISEARNRNVYYCLASREFELPELKLLVDSVQAAKFITERKSRELISKLEGLVSSYQARELHRQVIISGRVKTMNESIYYSVDKIHTAINQNSRIRFQYYQWNVKKEMELRHEGNWYDISPWTLIWNDEYYYLIGYDSQSGIIKHYRVDKMLHLSVTKEKRDGKSLFEKLDLPVYSRGLFGMYAGEATTVTLLCENHMVGAIIDRFGKDMPIVAEDPEHFRINVHVSISDQFLGWIIALGKGVKIVGPEQVVTAMREKARLLSEQYL